MTAEEVLNCLSHYSSGKLAGDIKEAWDAWDISHTKNSSGVQFDGLNKPEERIKFVLNGCDIQFIAEAPANITLRELLKQCDKIQPDWCACGIWSIERAEYNPNIAVEVYIDYDSVKKANDDVCCRIMEDNG